ncbi:hypothetical protein RFI_01546 [Reticulomyxa filosa]|uniref:Uncharacterized protein n=1 Tax=Reticulomyxa filosa TaxID=46433 RepID=X6PCW7_RETFI|nr:hypothetical protein RFI_01546 [Reticulomyxa filosa]|eukprot:ETO35517.1 hypothetical protein RFI_01546 [Reticulomyxa filosa]
MKNPLPTSAINHQKKRAKSTAKTKLLIACLNIALPQLLYVYFYCCFFSVLAFQTFKKKKNLYHKLISEQTNSQHPIQECKTEYEESPERKSLRLKVKQVLDGMSTTNGKKEMHAVGKHTPHKCWTSAGGHSNTTYNSKIRQELCHALANGSARAANLQKNYCKYRLSQHHKKQAQQILSYAKLDPVLPTIAHQQSSAKASKEDTESQKTKKKKENEREMQTHLTSILKELLNIAIANQLQILKKTMIPWKTNKKQAVYKNLTKCDNMTPSKKEMHITLPPSTSTQSVMESSKDNMDKIPVLKHKQQLIAEYLGRMQCNNYTQKNEPTQIQDSQKKVASNNVKQKCEKRFPMRMQLLKSVNCQLQIEKYNHQLKTQDIDTKLKDLQNEYYSLLEKISPETSGQHLSQDGQEKVCFFLIIQPNRDNYLNSKCAHLKIENGLHFKLSILHDLVHKLQLQQIFIRWKCLIAMQKLRKKFIDQMESQEQQHSAVLSFRDGKNSSQKKKGSN